MHRLLQKKIVQEYRDDSFYSDLAERTAQQLNEYAAKRALKFMGMNWVLINEKKYQKKHSPYKVSKKNNLNISYRSDIGHNENQNESMIQSQILEDQMIQEQFIKEYEYLGQLTTGNATPRELERSLVRPPPGNSFAVIDSQILEKGQVKEKVAEMLSLAQHEAVADSVPKYPKEIVDKMGLKEHEKNLNIDVPIIRHLEFHGTQKQNPFISHRKSSSFGNFREPDTLQEKDSSDRNLKVGSRPQSNAGTRPQSAANSKRSSEAQEKLNQLHDDYLEYLKAKKRIEFLQSRLVLKSESSKIEKGEKGQLSRSMFTNLKASDSVMPLEIIEEGQEEVTDKKKIPIFSGRNIKVPLTDKMQTKVAKIENKDPTTGDKNEKFGRIVYRDVFDDYFLHLSPHKNKNRSFIDVSDNSARRDTLLHSQGNTMEVNTPRTPPRTDSGNNINVSEPPTQRLSIVPRKLPSYQAQQLTKKITMARDNKEKLDQVIRQFRREVPDIMENRLLKKEINRFASMGLPVDSFPAKSKKYDAWFMNPDNRYRRLDKFLKEEGIKTGKEIKGPTQFEKKPGIPHEAFKLKAKKKMQIRADLGRLHTDLPSIRANEAESDITDLRSNK